MSDVYSYWTEWRDRLGGDQYKLPFLGILSMTNEGVPPLGAVFADTAYWNIER